MPKTKARCTVTVRNNAATPNPDPVPVKRTVNDGVEWVMATPGYEFTGVTIDDMTDFSEPTFSSDKRTMTVTDTVADLGDYTYTIGFKASATGEEFNFDPKIHNQLN